MSIQNISYVFRRLRLLHAAKAQIVAVDVFFMKRQPNAQMVSIFQLYILLKLFQPDQDRITKKLKDEDFFLKEEKIYLNLAILCYKTQSHEKWDLVYVD